MAVISEDFIRCTGCGCPDFAKKEVVTLPKGVKREDKTIPYPTLEVEITYTCAACGMEYE